MNTSKRHRLARTAIAVAALSATTARVLAAGELEFNLMQYELSFGQGRAQHSFNLSNFAPGDRFGEFAFSENGKLRVPLYSTNPKQWTLFRNGETEDSGRTEPLTFGNFLLGIIGLAGLALMAYATFAPAVEETRDALTFEPDIDLTGFTPQTTTGTRPKPAKAK
jgi:hypothetical protein